MINVKNELKFIVSTCPFCRQGLVEILKEIDTNTLFLCCDECEIEWDSPRDVLNKVNGTRFKYGSAIQPTSEEIQKKGWMNYIRTT